MALSGQQAPAEYGVIVEVNGVGICVEPFGDPADPATLLIHGAATSMYGWEDEFCRRLADGGRFVIRYDQRDTGRSVSYPPGQPGYGLADLVADVPALLDVFGLERAHLVGLSMGGGIAMGAALDFPERVASLTLIGTSPGGPGLPPMSPAFLEHIGSAEPPDWDDREAAIDHMLAFIRICAGPHDRLDEAEWRENLRLDLDRTTNVAASQINHFAMNPGAPIRDRLGEIAAPTLVIHGEHDPVFPPGHGEALAREIPNTELLILKDAGHLLTRPTWDAVIPAILRISSFAPVESEAR